MKKLLFIFNPTSGKARIKNQLFDIVNYYTQNDYMVTVVPTQYTRHVYEVLKNHQNFYDMIICSGGDGTLNEAISGIIDSENPVCLGYIPSGSTNDFARTIGIPSNLDKALDISIHGREHCIDIGMLNERYFMYVAAFGLFTNVPYSTPQKYKNSLGYMAYLLEGIRQISELKSYHIALSYEKGVIQNDFIVGMVTNSMSIGGFKNPTSQDVELDDGLFEVILIKKPNNILELQSIVSSLLSEKINTSYITYIQSSCLEIRSSSIDWTVDGEYGGSYEHVTIKNKNRFFTVRGE